MEHIEPYREREPHVVSRVPSEMDVEMMPAEPETPGTSLGDVVVGILRYWYWALIIMVLVAGAGLPCIWLFLKPEYSVAGLVHITPVQANLLSGGEDRMSNYESFVNTQVSMIVGERVVQRVADGLSDSARQFLIEAVTASPVERLKDELRGRSAPAEPVALLREAIRNDMITVQAIRRTELIKVAMKGKRTAPMKEIVDAFLRNYMAVEVSSQSETESRNLGELERERDILAGKLQTQREAINQLAAEYGSKNLTERHDMRLQRVAALLSELTRLQAARVNLEIKAKVLETAKPAPAMDATERLMRRQQYIREDPTLQLLAARVAQLEQTLVEARQQYTDAHPELAHRMDLLEQMKKRMEERREEVGKAFDELMTSREADMEGRELAQVKEELEQVKAHEARLNELLGQEDTQTIGIGQRQLEIQNLEEQYALTKQLYDTILRRIQEAELERRRPGRISVGEWGKVEQTFDKRVKLSAATLFGAVGLGLFLAFLRDRIDERLRTPRDVARRVGARIVGTTTSYHGTRPTQFREQIWEDYQTIRANLGLLAGDVLPHMLVVTSAAMAEGKTSFAINLATAAARSGKKVLLIDGDFRKPDVAPLLGFSANSAGLEEVLRGGDPASAVHGVPSSGLDVLVPADHNSDGLFELLASREARERITRLGEQYDHVVIDTPPLLAFSDALLWARISGTAVLVGFAGHTKASELRNAQDRLAEVGVQLLGVVLNNVEPGRGYYHYGYDYYKSGHKRRGASRRRKRMLLPLGEPDKK